MAEPKDILLRRVDELLEIERRFNIVFGAHPVPTWFKFLTEDHRLVMGMVNAAYTRATGISVTSYSGRPDEAVWASGESQEFDKVDRLVIRTGTAHRIAERAVNPRTKKVQYWVGWKWPYIYDKNVIGVVGCAEAYTEAFWNQFGADMLIAMGET